jgi:tetratricopeptide (TPR) repeat protein
MNPVPSPEQLPACGVDTENPWPGLVSFTEALQGFFHGRDEETDELQRRVERRDLTVFFGQSGLGKSSLLQAGLFPRLRRAGYLPVAIRLDHAPSAPPLSEQVKTAVTRVVVESGGVAESTAANDECSLWEYFHRRTLRLEASDGQPVRLVLVFDQFEELFAIGQASEETRSRAAQFLTELADLFENRAPEAVERRLEESPEQARQFVFDDRDYRALICLREDYLPHLESLRQSMPSIAENRMRLTRMNGLKALESVINPSGRLITPEVGRQVVRFVAGARPLSHDAAGAAQEDDGLAKLEVEPSLLSLVCRELNNRRLALGAAQITTDLLAGNRERILQDYYERCLADQPPAVRAFVEDELVTDSGLRENIALERARKVLTQHGAPASAIDELVKRRLLHLEERLDIQRVELTHDVLTTVVKKSRDERQQHEATLRVEQEAREVRDKARCQRRRLRWILAGMAVALVVVSGFGMFSFYLYQVSEERRLEAERQKERAEKGEQDADRAREEALTEKERAEANQNRAEKHRAALDDTLKSFSDDRLKTMPGSQAVLQVFLEKGVEQYSQMLRERPEDVVVKGRLADSYLALAILRSDLGVSAGALPAMMRAVEARRQLAGAEPDDPRAALELGQALFQLGQFHWEQLREKDAVAPVQESVEIFARLVNASPSNPSYKAALGRSLTRLASVKPEIDEEKTLLEARKLLTDGAKGLPRNSEVQSDLARVLNNLASNLPVQRKISPEGVGLYNEALKCTEQALALNPANSVAHHIRMVAVGNLAWALGQSKQPEEALRILQEATSDSKAFARKNPAVLRVYVAQLFVQKNLAQTFQRLSKPDQAIEVWQDITQTCEGLTQQYPQEARFQEHRVEALVSINLIEKNRNRKGAAAASLDRALVGAREVMRLHAHSSLVTDHILNAWKNRGFLESDAERPREALPFFLEGIALFEQQTNAGSRASEFAVGVLIDCTSKSLDCYRELKDLPAAIRLAERTIPAGKSLKDPDFKQRWLDLIENFARCCEDAGQEEKALTAYLLIRVEAATRVARAPWDYYSRSNLASSCRDLAKLYRRSGNLVEEVKTAREVLKQWSYFYGKDYGQLLSETAEATADNARRLRAVIDSPPGMKRFTVPTDFNGVKKGFHVYIANSWQPFEDQVRWVKEMRGGIVPPEVIQSFRRLHKIADENAMSFQDVVVFALGTAPKDEEKKAAITRLTDEIVKLKKEEGAAKEKAPIRRRLADAYARLANVYLESKSYEKAEISKDDALSYIERDAEGQPRSPDDKEALANALYVQGRVHIESGQLQQAYRTLLQSRLIARRGKEPKADSTQDVEYALGQVCVSLERRTEAASWYWFAAEAGHAEALKKIGELYMDDHRIAAAFPPELEEMLRSVNRGSSVLPLVGASVLGMIGSPQGLGPLPAACSLIPGKTPISEAQWAKLFPARFADTWKKTHEAAEEEKYRRDVEQAESLATQFHDLAEAYESKGRRDDARKALLKEFDALLQLNQLEPLGSPLASEAAKGEVAAKIGRLYLDAKETVASVEWTTRAAELNHVDSLFRLADWYEKGINVKTDTQKAKHYRYLGHWTRGTKAFSEARYKDALPDLKKAFELEEATAHDHMNLGACYRNMGQWDEAIRSYIRAIEIFTKKDEKQNATNTILSVLHEWVIAERPDSMIQFIQGVEKQGWKLPKESKGVERDAALFHGFRAIALRMSGKDATEAEKSMRQITGKPGFKLTGWAWDELDRWLKTTKLAPDRKAAIEKIIAELKGTAQK